MDKAKVIQSVQEEAQAHLSPDNGKVNRIDTTKNKKKAKKAYKDGQIEGFRRESTLKL